MGSQDIKSKSSPNSFVVKVYSSIFSILLLTLLVAFVSKPGLSLTDISTDFRWRKNLIALYSSFRFQIGDRVYNTALVGKDGWIFYTGNKSLQDYQKINDLDTAALAIMVARLNRLSSELEEDGKVLLVVVPPNKSTIYQQFMPDEIPVLGEKSRLDRFVEQTDADGGINVIDLRALLLSASKTRDVYFKVDTHWNDIGAYYGYYEILNSLSNYDSRLTPHPLSDYKYVYQRDLVNPDLPIVLGIPSVKEEHWALVPKFPVQNTNTTNLHLQGGGFISRVIGEADNLPSLLIFHDSFYSAHQSLSHFMPPHFSKITGILYTSEPEVWSLDWIQYEDPDVVIIEIVERNFDSGISSLLESLEQ